MLFKKFKQTAFFKWLALFLPLLMLSSLPILSDWMGNRYQVTLVDLALPLIMCSLTSFVLSLVFFKSFLKNKFAAILGAIGAVLIIGQEYDSRLSSVLPFLRSLSPLVDLKEREGIFYSLVFILLIIGLIFICIHFINRFTIAKKWPTGVFAKAIIIIISVAFVLQLFPTVKTIIGEWPQFFYRPPKLTDTTQTSSNKPDIYYIVLDRYTNQNILKTQFNYDNSDFINFLTSNNFSVNPNAYANYPYTTMSIASTMNANYNTDLVKKFAASPVQTLEPFHDSIRYGSVIEQLKSLGYSYDQLGSWYEASNQAPLADQNYQPEGQLTIFGHTFTLNNFSKMKLTNSVYWQFVKHGLKIGHYSIVSYGTIGESDATLYKLANLNEIAEQPAGGKFVFAHILVPHDPYYFNADGSISTSPDGNNVGETIKEKYVGQVEFINSQMKDLVTQIQKKTDNKAIIIIQADEGPYPMQLNGQNFDTDSVGDELDNGDMTKWSDTDLKMKYGVLAAYDVPAANKSDFATAGNSVNIFRLVLNTYFGAKLPYLPECNYAYTDGRAQSFVFQDITARLTGQANAACQTNSNF